jgi:hypothetical protein
VTESLQLCPYNEVVREFGTVWCINADVCCYQQANGGVGVGGRGSGEAGLLTPTPVLCAVE